MTTKMPLDGYIAVLGDPYLLGCFWVGLLGSWWWLISAHRRIDHIENKAIAIEPILKRLDIKLPNKYAKKTKPSLKAKAKDDKKD